MVLFSCAILPLCGEEQPSISPALAGALRKSGMPEAAESVIIPLDFIAWGFAVEVHIDGKPVLLVLDTGSCSTVLSPKAAKKLGLNVQEVSGTVSTASGEKVGVRRAMTKRLRLGNAWTENEPVLVSEMPPGFDGLVGVSTLADWDVRIDPSTKMLTLFPAGKAAPLEGETTLLLSCGLTNPETSASNRQGLRMMNLSVPAHVGNHEVTVVPDTGDVGGILQFSSVLMKKLAPEVMMQARPGLVTGMSLSGKMVSRTVKLPQFTFGPDTLRDLITEVIDATPGSGVEHQGIIGLNLLRHYVMTFRFSTGELRLKPLGTVQEITRASTAGINLGPEFKILSVKPDGPADKAGLRAGDEMLEIEDHPLKTMKPEEFAALKLMPPGSMVKVRYRRGEGSPVEVRLVLVKE